MKFLQPQREQIEVKLNKICRCLIDEVENAETRVPCIILPVRAELSTTLIRLGCPHGSEGKEREGEGRQRSERGVGL